MVVRFGRSDDVVDGSGKDCGVGVTKLVRGWDSQPLLVPKLTVALYGKHNCKLLLTEGYWV